MHTQMQLHKPSQTTDAQTHADANTQIDTPGDANTQTRTYTDSPKHPQRLAHAHSRKIEGEAKRKEFSHLGPGALTTQSHTPRPRFEGEMEKEKAAI